MSATLFVPFEWNPISTTIKTGAYTVPMGYRARVRPTNLETDFTVDTVVAVEKTKYIGSTAITATGTVFTNTSAYCLVGGVVSNGNGADQYNVINPNVATGINFYQTVGNPFNSGTNAGTPIAAAATNSWGNKGVTGTTATSDVSNVRGLFIPQDCAIYASEASTGSPAYHYSLTAMSLPTPDWFWVPEDTDLDGTRYVVELYANIA
jgi:hypothetical protein